MKVSFASLWMPNAEREPVTPLGRLEMPKPPPAPNSQDAAAAATHLVAMVARAAVETLTGYRPIRQLRRWLTSAAINELELAKRHGAWDGAAVSRVWASEVSPNTIEGVAQLIVDGHRVAVPIRLERRGEQWGCTELSVMLPGTHQISQPDSDRDSS